MRSPVHRIIRRIDLEDHGFDTRCWVRAGLTLDYWTVNEGGAGTKKVPGHRLIYEHFSGHIPEGYEIDHLCRIKGCVNPTHLEPVTHSQNLKRGNRYTDGRTHCTQGHELTDDNIIIQGAWPHRRSYRACRICAREQSKRSWEKQRDKVNARRRAAYWEAKV